ncbi:MULTISPECIES: flagellar hook-basal body complex protein [Aeromonas]|uniref:flagellar hook-basal body complex protein n=1 Tax=Aeromonas TaxID=642 RepID=UPI0019208F27|nr:MULTISPECIES: flagellar hook-basal body complex protein [Aeromonas]MBL0578912.1 flagellar hook-basal body complex protein [Aeromonas caviae]MDX7842922.1 flagellar hook-basal body complex protein [Aeromonas caviae]
MSFNNALSGINAAQKDLNVTANNIANVNTTGFKESRAEFADVYANSIFVNAKTQVGNGVATGAVAQQFHQGALQFTNNALDLAIQGNGFFVTSDGLTNLDRTYTRAGAFKLNENSYMVSNSGGYLQGYEINADGTPKAVSITATRPIQIPDRAGEPVQTSQVNASFNLPTTSTPKASGADPLMTSQVNSSFNLDSSADVINPGLAFDPNDSSTYSMQTTTDVYDSLGEKHTITQYFAKDADPANPTQSAVPATWRMYLFQGTTPININDAGTPRQFARINFDTSGTMTGTVPAELKTVPLGTPNPPSAVPGAGINMNGANESQVVEFKFDAVSESASPYKVNQLSQDGIARTYSKFDPKDSTTYSSSTSVVAYDSLGEPHTITQYFVKEADSTDPSKATVPTAWRMYLYEGDKPIDIVGGQATAMATGLSQAPLSARVTFDASGRMQTPTSPEVIKTEPLGTPGAGIITNGADGTQDIELKLGTVTQYASPFEVNQLTQDGSTVGRLTKVEITGDGIISATYSNATTVKVAMVAMAKFANSQGLTQVGDTSWRQSLLSGDALPGTPNSGTFGSIKSSALEQSNVDLTTELVDLITAQRNFQANSRSLEVNSSLQQNILQIR